MDISLKGRLLDLILGSKALQSIATTKVLVIGAGGIGCQLIKNLAKSGYKNITLLDFDSIEITNLNRQFYFRKQHIGKAKSETVKLVLEKMDSSIIVNAVKASIYEEKFNQAFYSQFDLIFSCLDNMKARQHLAAQATRNGKPLIDAGTMSYFGQTFCSIRFKTSCHNCNPTHSEQAPASCTIRTHPQLPVHCATYAKNFYDSFFGINQAQALSDNLKFSKYVSSNDIKDEQISTIVSALFEEMFNHGIHDIDLQGNKIDFVRKLSGNEAKTLTEVVKNPQKSTFNEQEHKKHLQAPYKQEKLWSISQYQQQFLNSATKLLKRKLNTDSPVSFDKDDDDCMTLVLCITNLRTYNFINQESIHNKHKYLTFYQCKDLIGKILPAIASTNAIAAALEAREAVNIITKQLDKIRYITFGNKGDERISPSIQSTYNSDCQVCSQKIIYVSICCNMETTTFLQLQEFAAANFFTRNRDVTCGGISIIRNSKKGNHPNKKKFINFIPEMIHNGVLNLTFPPQIDDPQFVIHLNVIHDQNQKGIRMQDDCQARSSISKQLKSYFQKVRNEIAINLFYEVETYGGFQL